MRARLPKAPYACAFVDASFLATFKTFEARCMQAWPVRWLNARISIAANFEYFNQTMHSRIRTRSNSLMMSYLLAQALGMLPARSVTRIQRPSLRRLKGCSPGHSTPFSLRETGSFCRLVWCRCFRNCTFGCLPGCAASGHCSFSCIQQQQQILSFSPRQVGRLAGLPRYIKG